MRKAYYIITIIFSVLVILLFDVVALTSLDEKSMAAGALIISIIAIGCMILSITGLRKNQYIGGVFLEKIGIILFGFALLVLEIGFSSGENILQAIILIVIALILGALSYTAGMRLIRRKRTESFNWNIYKEILFEKMPQLRETLNEGASAKDISGAENTIGVRFPEYLKELYLTNSGDDNEAMCGMIMGLHFMSLESLINEWRGLKKIADDPKKYHAPKFFRRFAFGEINGTITASAQPENCGITHPIENRRYSVRECARIQSFPDDFRFNAIPLQSQYKVIGNAVPPIMAWVVATALLNHL